ncbi:PEGA domain-containing protein [Patescibacteria group bacterium]|nr:PEGA domain-containing protein [Patescibacteria group bacterium]
MVDQNLEPNQPKADSSLSDQLPSDLKVAVSAGGGSKMAPTPVVAESAAGEQGGSPGFATKWIIIAVSIFVILLLAGTAYFLFSKAGIGTNRGTLDLSLEPAGADIVIDGKFKRQAVSSLSIKLKPGEHTLLATKEGYLDWEQEFTLSANESKEINLKLNTIPNIEVLIEGNIAFPELIRNGRSIAYMSAEGSFSVINLDTNEQASLFGNHVIAQARFINWASGEPMALAKLDGMPKLSNLRDNRSVRGRFVPLGERPVQGAPRNTGTSSWFLNDTNQTAAGWQPVLLNESIGSFDFSPDSSRIIYFYHTADGEQSLVVAHPDGGEWERLATQVPLVDPELVWLNSERYILLLDDKNDGTDQIFDMVSKNFSEAMPDRLANTTVASSPDGTRILYVSEENGYRLAVWNLLSSSREKLFEEAIDSQTQFVWQTDDKFILNKDDGSLWYWNLNGKEKPMQFVSAAGPLEPIKLFYSIINHQLLVVEQTRILSLKA